ncbi:MAG: hypothetical protein KGY78_10870 [Anaerolineae bacterium]|nr:hypothetical protein [Anaerolineae bacterium]
MEYLISAILGFVGGGVAAGILHTLRDYRMKKRVEEVLERDRKDPNQDRRPNLP